MDRVYIVPGRTNSEEKLNGHWKIMIEEAGKSRHINDALTHLEAAEKAQRAAAKRGITFDDGNTSTKVEAKESEVASESQPDYMKVSRPRGAPDLGAKVTETLPDDTIVTGTVVAHLATQFVIETPAGDRRILHADGTNWAVC